MRTGIAIWVLGAFLAVASLSAARAQEDDDWQPRDRVVAGQVAPLDRILPEIRRNHPGTFYDAQGPFQGADGEMHYRLKWMTPEGRVIWFDANARTGRVLGAGVGRHDFDNGGGPYEGGNYDRDGANYGNQNYGGRNNFGGHPDYDGGGYGNRGQGPAWGGGRGGWQGGHGGWQGGHGWQGGGRGGGERGGGGGHHGHGGY
jgi:hypothetical protein